MIREFTGRHMLMAMLAFFGVVIGVNVVMATLASRTFGGLIIDNGYVASREYNGWLKAAHAQAGLDWAFAVARAGDHVEISARSGGAAMKAVDLTAVAAHPLGIQPERRLHFRSTAAGHYVSVETLPPGRWRLHLEARQGRERFRLVSDIPA